jgi:hypothetical protein
VSPPQILASEDRETFTPGPEAEAALLAAIEETDLGELVSEEELWRELLPELCGEEHRL